MKPELARAFLGNEGNARKLGTCHFWHISKFTRGKRDKTGTSPLSLRYNDYIKLSDRLTDIEFTLSMLSGKNKTAVKLFKEFHHERGKEDFVIARGRGLTEEQVKRKIKSLTGGLNANEISQKPKAERNQIIAKLREEGLTIGQLERATGISRGIITRAKNI